MSVTLETHPFDPESPLTPTGNLRRRLIVSRIVQITSTAAALFAVGMLTLVTIDVIKEGAKVISFTFFTSDPPTGIKSAIIGSTLIVAVAALIATPLGILTAVYLTEYARPKSKLAATIRLGLDLMQGLPAVVIGLFAFGLIVKPARTDSGFAAAVALSLIMLPLIARSTQEVLRTIPVQLRDGADALGVNRWRAILTVVVPVAISGVLTATIIAVARAAGETAPLLITDSLFTNGTTFQIFGHAVPNIPVMILTLAEAQNPLGFPRAWGAALSLLVVILIANIVSRLMLARSRRKMAG